MHLVGFIIIICHDARSHERKIHGVPLSLDRVEKVGSEGYGLDPYTSECGPLTKENVTFH